MRHINNVEKLESPFNGNPVCRGNIFFVKTPDKKFWKKGDLMITGNENYFVSTHDMENTEQVGRIAGCCPVFPIIVAPKEPIFKGDRMYDKLSKKVIIAQHNYQNSEDQQYFKIIAFVADFSSKHFESFTDGTYKNGDEVLVTCDIIEETDDKYELWVFGGKIDFHKVIPKPLKNKSFILCLTCGDTYEHVPTILLVNAPNKEFIINNIEKIKKEQDLNSTKYSIQSISELDMTKMHILITEGFIE